MTAINTNLSATRSQNALRFNARAMETSMQRLSTGKRINSGSDDSSGVAMVARMKSSAAADSQSVRNANDAISMLHTFSTAGRNILEIAGRLGELWIQAETDTYSQRDREALNTEAFQLLTEWSRLANTTFWNGAALMATNQTGGGALTIGLGGTGKNITVSMKDWRPQANQPNATAGTAVNGSATPTGDPFWNLTLSKPNTAGVANTIAADNLLTSADRTIWGPKIGQSITGMVEELTQMGFYINRLQTVVDDLTSAATNTTRARSAIQDINYAKETSKMSKTQILAQAGTAILSQANISKQTVIALLQ